jgi:hypothetical protein
MGYDEVGSVDADLIHSMGNLGDKPIFTLHLYGRAEADPAITEIEQGTAATEGDTSPEDRKPVPHLD